MDRTIRICGDYKQTINQAAKLENYPIPKIEDLYAIFGGGMEFTNLLVHYDPSKELVLSCNASPYGLEAVFSDIVDGKERPISYASRTLSPAERNYAKLDKEGTALIFGLSICTDRNSRFLQTTKPLLGLFKADKAVPTMASSRIQRWALLLADYDYELVYREDQNHANADDLSRMPLPDTIARVPTPG